MIGTSTFQRITGYWRRLTSGSVNRRIFGSIMTVGVFTIGVKAISFAKELIVAQAFGTGDALDAFLVAFGLTNYLAAVVAMPFGSAMLPSFVREREQAGEEAAQRLLATVVLLVLALVGGAVLFGEALLTQFYAVVFSPLFWLYHVRESFGFGMISYAVLVGYWRGHSRESLIDSLLLSGTRARLQAEYIEAMDALVDALAHGDRPTPELRAMLRERAGLAEGQVQVFERAARAIADERRQRKQLEELNAALRQLEMHKTQLTQMVVHDLKNPLTALIAYLEVLSISALSQDQHELLTGALRSSRNLSALIGDLLDIARLEEGQLELEMSTFAVHDLLRECVDSMDIWLQQEHKSIEVHAPTATLLLDADLRLLRRVLANLLSNAIKHTPPGTHIRLSAEIVPATADQQAMVAIMVADDGPGIPPERLGRIFDRFGSFAEPKNGTRQGSTGLGLTLCRLVAEAHGGAVTVSSSVGEGATFRVLLPSLELPA